MARSITGTVVSDKADKTIVLSVTERKTHPIYKKQYSKTVKYISHDEKNEAKIGDVVEVVEVRPISARKRMTLVRIVERAAISADKTVDAVTAVDEVTKSEILVKKSEKNTSDKNTEGEA